MSENIILLGVLFLGGFVGLLLGLTLQLPKSPNLKLVTGIIGAALGGVPVVFMDNLAHEKWMYPIGLVVGLLWIRVLAARNEVNKKPKKAERLAWYMAWIDTLAVVGVTLVIVVAAAIVQNEPAHASGRPVTRKEMPCRWAWIYLGRYSKSKGRYELPEAFRYDGEPSFRNPVPSAGDRIILTSARSLLVNDWGIRRSCDAMLDPPWAYRPESAKDFEAGSLKAETRVLVNQTTLMPSSDADPMYVWVLAGPEK